MCEPLHIVYSVLRVTRDFIAVKSFLLNTIECFRASIELLFYIGHAGTELPGQINSFVIFDSTSKKRFGFDFILTIQIHILALSLV